MLPFRRFSNEKNRRNKTPKSGLRLQQRPLRHDLVRDHIAKVARQAGLTAQIEQKMLIPGQTQEDLPRAGAASV